MNFPFSSLHKFSRRFGPTPLVKGTSVIASISKSLTINQIMNILLLFRVGADVDVSIEDLSLSGRVQIVFEMDHLVPFPHMKSVAVTFLEK